jgi:hypothetical protein
MCAPSPTRFDVRRELIGAYRKKQVEKMTETQRETNPVLQVAQDELWADW